MIFLKGAQLTKKNRIEVKGVRLTQSVREWKGARFKKIVQD